MEPLLMDVEGAAKVLGIGRSLFYQLLQTGQIESLKIGRRRVVPAAAVEAFVQRLREEQAWISDAEPDRPVPSSLRTTGNG